MGVIEKAVAWAIEVANDPRSGYSQADRWGPDYDCSSFVISAYEQAGVPVREAGATYTGNMRSAFIACGFVDVTYEIGLSSGYGIQPGDVLLNYSAHTCLAVGGGKVANCRTDEGHPQSGDQGQEIRVQSYWNYPWNCVLRYKGSGGSAQQGKPEEKPAEKPAEENHIWKPSLLKLSNSYSADCVVLQALLNVHHFACGSADGFFGAKTQAALIRFQKWAFPDDKAQWDGVCGPKTWDKLLERG